MPAPASYQRVGHCLGCGQHCCTSVVIPFTPQMGADFLAHKPVWVQPRGDPDYDHWLALHGIDGEKLWTLPRFTTYRIAGDAECGRLPVAVIPLRCHALNDDGSCALYDSPERPQMCAEWPWEPIDLHMIAPAARSACGYSFVKGRPHG